MIVVTADAPRLRVERDVVAAVIRQGAAFTVYASAHPRPQFTWYNGSAPVTPSTAQDPRPRVDITTASYGDDDDGGGGGLETDRTDADWKPVFRYSSTLTLSNVEAWDLTEYRVVVANDYGSNETSLRLVEAST